MSEEKHIFNNKWLTEKEIRELCEKEGCSCPDDVMTQAANTPAAIRIFFMELGRKGAREKHIRLVIDGKTVVDGDF